MRPNLYSPLRIRRFFLSPLSGARKVISFPVRARQQPRAAETELSSAVLFFVERGRFMSEPNEKRAAGLGFRPGFLDIRDFV